MAKFRMVALGSKRMEVKSEKTNDKKLNWFIAEIDKCKKRDDSILYIKIYRSGRKIYEYYLSQKDINNLCLQWINYKQ